MYKYLIRPVLFLFDPEAVHHFSFRAIKFFSILGLGGLFRKIFVVNDRRLEREVFGVKFKNPVGLAAGFDKDAKLYNEFSDFGFGFVEIGTVTPKPQPGNPKKRLFRLRDDQAIINRMGFNNKGVFDAVEQLKKKHRVIVGGNIGKNKVTPNDEALKDYLICFEALYEHVDYFVVNVSSPNTPGLRELQDKEPLTKLLKKLKNQNKKLAKNHQRKEKPILLKIAPDLTDDQLLDIIEIVADTKIDGVIATNTTIARQNLKSHLTLTEEMGGLSGKPLTNRSTEVIRFLSENSRKAFPIIGVGGIHSPEDALEKLEAGADLVQLYTGFIYEGPGLIKKINKAILEKMA
ncbi:MAG: quinone-dependent dihydroorotate dehydrogenase [Muricauda sp.]|jgi:dihydroorotate dehydrogenase|nr:quinone-dependent dihydroorotate dehydrogenase [Allomuricauda sp.]MBO6533455.1 quinone-dependent dihydroorotate dehydrogenase [Allomuricauda sp.]MBO6588739.1 quinone-dependent dihydroorotate dehydrogenase [Allomuricauda sp.]MBO6618122.1 quinone-dependent dihydroorotate dehydrogenase [Allomuricauda sp.]MBO6644277.1 quinone-dependent dihydroorotate dehydrogenase [Allomuricauda sp.]MBO6747854.1 quinone-dependent dihydroorotate dehydrogenase [Allomuricauda sp.]